MKLNILTTLAALTVTASSVMATGHGWMTDYKAAKAKAQAENKDLLVEFTGSDWCPPCMALNKNVFSKEAFTKAAAKKFVLVGLDYPRGKKLPAELKKQNDQLLSYYGVQAFPTVLLCDAKGMPYAATGFRPGGPEDYVKNLNELAAEKAKRDKAIAEANKLEGKAKADALWAVLNGLKQEYGINTGLAFDPILKEILKADPSDKDGKIEKLYIFSELSALSPKQDPAPVFKKLDNFIAKHKITGEQKQELLISKLDALFTAKKYPAMLVMIDEIVKIAPDSRISAMLKQAKPGIQKMVDKAKQPATK